MANSHGDRLKIIRAWHRSFGMTSPAWPMDARRAGFTLIELLVVISIVAMLISMLLPAIKSAKESSKRVTCASNQRQIGIALLAYVQDNENGSPPPYGYPDHGGVGSYAWLPKMPGWRGLGLLYDNRPPTSWRSSPLGGGTPAGNGPGGAGYLRKKEVFYCPTSGVHGVDDVCYGWPADDQIGKGDHCNVAVDIKLRQPAAYQHNFVGRSPTGEVTLFEELEEGGMAWIFDKVGYLGLGRSKEETSHPGGLNVLFPDMHVRFHRVDIPLMMERHQAHPWLIDNIDGVY